MYLVTFLIFAGIMFWTIVSVKELKDMKEERSRRDN